MPGWPIVSIASPMGFFGPTAEDSGYDYDQYGGVDDMVGLYYGDFVLSGETRTDSDGLARISFESPAADGHNYRYIVEADVIDATNKRHMEEDTPMLPEAQLTSTFRLTVT